MLTLSDKEARSSSVSLLKDPYTQKGVIIIILEGNNLVSPPSDRSDSMEVARIPIPTFKPFGSRLLEPKDFLLW